MQVKFGVFLVKNLYNGCGDVKVKSRTMEIYRGYKSSNIFVKAGYMYYKVMAFMGVLLLAVLAGMAGAEGPPIPIATNWDYNCLPLGEADIARFVADAKQAGLAQVNLRILNKGALNCRLTDGGHGTVYTERLDAYGPAFNPLAALVQECHAQGIKACVWVDLFEACYDEFFINHPEFCAQGKPGEPDCEGMPSYSHAEVRQYFLDRLDEFIALGPDSVFFCTKSNHVPQNMTDLERNTNAGYNPPVVAKYLELYGVDILTQPFDLDKMRLINGEFLLDFLVAARAKLNAAGIKMFTGATVSGLLQVGCNVKMPWERVVARQAADVLCMANSRSEYWVFFTSSGKTKLAQIITACHNNGMEFYGYFMASGGYDTIISEKAWSGLLKYIPIQMDYFRQMGADGVLMHDLESLGGSRAMRKVLWTTTASWTGVSGASPPTIDNTNLSFTYQVPQGDFEAGPLVHWYAMPAWELFYAPDAPGNFAGSAASGWSGSTGGNPDLSAEYDWKVMHNDDASGRAFYSRSSLLVVAEANAGNYAGRTVEWKGQDDIPIVPAEEVVISIWAHGEGLVNIQDAGLKVTVLDAGNQILDTLKASCPLAGTFVWQKLSIPYSFPANAAKLAVSAFMTVEPGASADRRRLWFDKFRIEPNPPMEEDALTIVHDANAFKGNGYARFKGRSGVDMVSMGFVGNITDRMVLQLAMKAESPMAVTVMIKGYVSETFEVGTNWDVYRMPLPLMLQNTAISIVIQPHGDYDLYIDEVSMDMFRVFLDNWLNGERTIEPVEPDAEGLVAHYAFESNANDSAGGHDGTVIGNPTYAAGLSGYGQAICFDGTGDYVNCGHSEEFDLSEAITVAAWIKVASFDKIYQAVAAKGTSGTGVWRLDRYNSTNAMRFYCGTIDVRANGSISVNDGQWHHVAGVFDGSNVVLYVDGIADSTIPASGAIGTNANDVQIGARVGICEWNGMIDDVRIYDYGLSHGEIAYLCDAGTILEPLGWPATMVDFNDDQMINFIDYCVLVNNWLE